MGAQQKLLCKHASKRFHARSKFGSSQREAILRPSNKVSFIVESAECVESLYRVYRNRYICGGLNAALDGAVVLEHSAPSCFPPAPWAQMRIDQKKSIAMRE